MGWGLIAHPESGGRLRFGPAPGDAVDLTEVCQANPRVVAVPPPQIYFEAYGDSSLNFTVWVHVRIPSDRMPATA